jgi:hypothetical protein
MTWELEGDLSLARAHSRRWLSIIAVVIPVVAAVLLSAWFIRAYISPPTVAIHNPAMMAEAPPPPPAVPRRAVVEAPPPPMAVAQPAEPPVPETSQKTSALPMFATLAAAPPSLASAPPAYADPVLDTPAVPSIIVAEPAEIEAAEPITGPVPLPRAKPHGRVAAVAGPIPLPRPRPAEAAPEPDLPEIDRHSIN